MLYWFWEDGSYSSILVKNKQIILEIVKQFSVAVILKSHSVKKDNCEMHLFHLLSTKS